MWISKTLVVMIAVVSFSVMAEEGDHKGGGDGAKGAAATDKKSDTASRAIAPDQIRAKDVDLVAKLFSHLGKDFATSIFTVGAHLDKVDYLPWSKALEKAKTEKDETDTSATMAVLFGTVKDDRRDALLKEINEVRSAELKKDKDKLDPKYMDLLDRLMWAGKAVTGTLDKSPEAQEFLKKFVGEKLDFKSGDFKKIQDQNEDVLSKIKAAQAGDPTAKAFLRDNLNRGAALAYAKDQVEKGNKAGGAGLLEAVSWKQNGTGPKFIDMVGPGNEPQRLFIGETPADQAAAIQAMGPKLANTALAQKQFEKVAKEWWVKDGKLTPGVPPGAVSAIGVGEEKKITQGAESNNGGGNQPNAGSFDFKKAEAALTTSCSKCHGATTVTGSTPGDLKIKMAMKGERSLSAALNAIKTVGGMKDLAGLGSQIEAWLAQK